METIKYITKDNVIVVKDEGVKIETRPISDKVEVTKIVATLSSRFGINKEVLSNAELICEAFNVANEIGLSPIQMKERIKELEKTLKETADGYSHYKNLFNRFDRERIEKAEKILNPKT